MKETAVLGFTGKYRDPVSAGYPLGRGYRWYLPSLMRFNLPDNFSPFGRGGINPYVYCDADPINHADPSGHMPVSEGLLDAIKGSARQGEAVAGSLRRTRSVSFLPEDQPIAADTAIHRTNSAPVGLSEHDMQAHPPAQKRFRPESPDPDQPGTSNQGLRFAELRKLPDVTHLPHLWDIRDTNGSKALICMTHSFDRTETEWISMRPMLTRQDSDELDEAERRFRNIHNDYSDIKTRLNIWKTTTLSDSFDRPAMRASGDTFYRIVARYLNLANRMKRLSEEWTPAKNFFTDPEGFSDIEDDID